MLEVIGTTGIYAIVLLITLTISSLVGLVLFVNKEENFEDVIAAQKKEQNALLHSLQGSTKPNKSNKKWSKLKEKKEKSKKDNEEGGSDVDDDEPNTESLVLSKSTSKSEKNSAKKLIGKTKVELDSQLSVDKRRLKSDNKSTKLQKDKIRIEETVVVSETVKLQSESPIKVETEIDSSKVATSTDNNRLSDKITEIPKKKQDKKAKSTNSLKGKENHILEMFLKEIENIPLNTAEMQELIDILLAKQSESNQWKKTNQKSDPVEQLRKEVSDLKMQLSEEQKNYQNLSNKQKELKHELQQEKSQNQSAQSVTDNKLAQQAKAHEVVCKKMKEQHVSETHSLQAQIIRMQQLIDGGSSIGGHLEMQRLKDENSHLKNASLRASQLAEDNKSLMNELNQLQQGNKQLRQDAENTRLQFQQLQSTQRTKSVAEETLSQRLQKVSDELLTVEGKNRSLLEELQQSRGDSQILKTEVEQLRKQSISDDTLKNHVAQVAEANKKVKFAEDQLSSFISDSEKQKSEHLAIQTELNQLKKILPEREQKINTLTAENTQLKMSIEKNNSGTIPNQEDVTKIKELEVLVKENQEKEAALQEDLNSLKKKNNELREKNWKAVDALNKSEEENAKKAKTLETELLKALQSTHPGVKLPAFDPEKVAQFFELYKVNIQNSVEEKEIKLNEVRLHCEALENELNELKISSKMSNNDEIQKMQKENSHLKNVLAETELLLSKLQAGVDAEVSKWQVQVENKDQDLEEANNKISELEDLLHEHGFEKQEEISQPDGVSSKKKKHGFRYTLTKIIHPKMESQLKEAHEHLEQERNEKKNLLDTVAKLESELKLKQELLEKQSLLQVENDGISGKLKKATSERDLVIREYKALKDSTAKSQGEINKLNNVHEQEKKELLDKQSKELKSLTDQLSAMKMASQTSGKGDKEKDKLIAKLYLEIEELKEDLREERDRVIVDIGSEDTEKLHQQVDALTEEKLNLSVKLNDLEKSFQEEQTDREKVVILESKLKAAEARIKDLEAADSHQIKKEIADAMQQAADSAGTTV